MKFICVQCGICKALGPGFSVRWMDLTVQRNAELQQLARRKGWSFEGVKDKCPECSGLNKSKVVKSKKTIEAKEFAKKVSRLKGK